MVSRCGCIDLSKELTSDRQVQPQVLLILLTVMLTFKKGFSHDRGGYGIEVSVGMGD